jgi:hypothetical protein
MSDSSGVPTNIGQSGKSSEGHYPKERKGEVLQPAGQTGRDDKLEVYPLTAVSV